MYSTFMLIFGEPFSTNVSICISRCFFMLSKKHSVAPAAISIVTPCESWQSC
jgi:hypothetical protein